MIIDDLLFVGSTHSNQNIYHKWHLPTIFFWSEKAKKASLDLLYAHIYVITTKHPHKFVWIHQKGLSSEHRRRHSYIHQKTGLQINIRNQTCGRSSIYGGATCCSWDFPHYLNSREGWSGSECHPDLLCNDFMQVSLQSRLQMCISNTFELTG